MKTDLQKNGRIATTRLVLLILGVMLGLFALGIWRCFHTSSALSVLRNSMESSVEHTLHSRFSFNAGFLIFGLARTTCSFLSVPPEVTVGLQTIRGVETSICQWDTMLKPHDYLPLIEKVDKDMQRNGWERMVTVIEEGVLVLVFNSTKNQSPKDQRYCVVVSEGNNLILASVRGNWDPLMAYASRSLRHVLRSVPEG